MMLRLRETSFRAGEYSLVVRRSSFGSRGIPAGRTRASRRVTVMSYGPPPAGYMPSADEQLANRPRCVSPRLVARRASDRSSRRVPRDPVSGNADAAGSRAGRPRFRLVRAPSLSTPPPSPGLPRGADRRREPARPSRSRERRERGDPAPPARVPDDYRAPRLGPSPRFSPRGARAYSPVASSSVDRSRLRVAARGLSIPFNPTLLFSFLTRHLPLPRPSPSSPHPPTSSPSSVVVASRGGDEWPSTDPAAIAATAAFDGLRVGAAPGPGPRRRRERPQSLERPSPRRVGRRGAPPRRCGLIIRRASSRARAHRRRRRARRHPARPGHAARGPPRASAGPRGRFSRARRRRGLRRLRGSRAGRAAGLIRARAAATRSIAIAADSGRRDCRRRRRTT